MRGRIWLNSFINTLKEKEKTDYPENPKSDPEWTKFMKKVMEGVAEKMDCYVAQSFQEKGKESCEYLNIDAIFIDNAEYDIMYQDNGQYDPFVLPRAVVELENEYNIEKISYCLWKILCVRAPIRVLICYQNGKEKVKSLREHLENVIWQGSLMKGSDGDLLVVIGDDSARGEASWEDYFMVFEWRSDRLEKIEGLKW